MASLDFILRLHFDTFPDEVEFVTLRAGFAGCLVLAVGTVVWANDASSVDWLLSSFTELAHVVLGAEETFVDSALEALGALNVG